MIERMDDCLQISGNITMTTVNVLFAKGLGLKINGKTATSLTVDFAQLEKVDSSAVSLMLAWLREARGSNVKLHFVNTPKNLVSLANLYGVAELLGLEAA